MTRSLRLCNKFQASLGYLSQTTVNKHSLLFNINSFLLVCMCTCMIAYMCLYGCVYECLHACVCMCVSVWVRECICVDMSA